MAPRTHPRHAWLAAASWLSASAAGCYSSLDLLVPRLCAEESALGDPVDSNAPCADSAQCAPGQFCDARSCDGPGRCAARCGPEVDPYITDEYACGCDGLAYDTVRSAHARGVRVVRGAACPGNGMDPSLGRGCLRDADCDAGLWCVPTVCGVAAGFCRPPRGACAPGELPACGCDGALYPSACEASNARQFPLRPDDYAPDRCSGPAR